MANPVPATLELDFTGWAGGQGRLFEREVLSADFIVPMYPSAKTAVEAVLRRMRRKTSAIIDVDFRGIGGQYNEAKYRLILETIRQRLKKEGEK
ncbi:MAG: hypothetical protein NTW59_04895 [Candidatus Diapherotrites archaeon]|nr:hypothetical protein [Candidatus Diapherotrites archaeon]